MTTTEVEALKTADIIRAPDGSRWRVHEPLHNGVVIVYKVDHFKLYSRTALDLWTWQLAR